MIKKFTAAFLAGLILTVPAYSQNLECKIDAVTKKVIVNADVSDGVIKKRFSCTFVKPLMDVSQITPETINDFDNYVFQGESDDNGKIHFEFPMKTDSPSGFYKLYLNIEEEGREEAEAYFANDNDGDSLASKLANPQGENDTEKITYIKTILENDMNRDILNMDEKYYLLLTDKDKAYRMLYLSSFEGNRKSFNEKMNEIVFLCAINELPDAEDILSYYSSILDFQENVTYKKYLSYSDRKKITFEASGAEDITKLFDIMAYKIISDKLSNILRWENTIDILKEFQAETKIDFTDYNKVNDKQGLVSDFINSLKPDLESIKTVFDNLVSSYIKKENTATNISSPSTSGSSGGGGGGYSSHVTIVPQTEEKKENEEENNKEDEISLKFSDIQDHWAKEAIENLSDKKIINGYNDGTFRPNSYVTREQFAKMCVETFKIKAEKNEISFVDVNKDSWSYDYINALSENNIINGNQNGEFEPQREITRQEICTIVGRCLEVMNVKLNENKNIEFFDYKDIAPYALKYVSSLANSGIVNGVGENRFAPNDSTNRAMAAKIIYEVLKVTEE